MPPGARDPVTPLGPGRVGPAADAGPTRPGGLACAAAALIALTAWVGLAVQFAAVLGRTASPAAALWVMLAYFTVTTNLLIAVLFTGVAAGRPACAASR